MAFLTEDELKNLMLSESDTLEKLVNDYLESPEHMINVGLHKRSGDLGNDGKIVSKGKISSGVKFSFEFKQPYALIQEYGGVISHRKKQWLTVPINTKAMFPNGKTRPARSFDFLKFIPYRQDVAYLVDRQNNEVYYQLRKKVKLKKKLWFQRTIKEVSPAYINGIKFKKHNLSQLANKISDFIKKSFGVR